MIPSQTKTHNIAIIGLGPRGLASLEHLYLAQQAKGFKDKIAVTLFESSPYPGAGQVWSPEQAITNLANVHERLLSSNLKGRPTIVLEGFTIPEFPGYGMWLKKQGKDEETANSDYFPPRAKLGAYLNTRFNSIKNFLEAQGLLALHKKTVTKVETHSAGCVLIDAQNLRYEADEVLLTIGHQPTEDSGQLKQWEQHAKQYEQLQLFKDPYPVDVLKTPHITPKTKVALRGFGLSMLDQVRALSLGFGGIFIHKNNFELEYIPSGKEPEELLVFSLDGLPPAPKPVNEAVDGWFEPAKDGYDAFKAVLDEVHRNPKNIQDASFLIKAIAVMTASVFMRLGKKTREYTLEKSELIQLTEKLIKNPELAHPLVLSHKLPALEAVKVLLQMAFGHEKISLDYCLGQVWRFALGVLYHDHFNLNLNDKAMTDVVKYIEASKRYSYGPPVASLQQLVALVEAGKLKLNFADNPEITLVPLGWKLQKDNKEAIVQVMVNSIIDAPQLVKVNSSLIKNFLDEHEIDPVSYKLGLHTRSDGKIISKTQTIDLKVSFLGRLAKGSSIGVDDLVECFGKPASLWAKGVLKRLQN